MADGSSCGTSGEELLDFVVCAGESGLKGEEPRFLRGDEEASFIGDEASTGLMGEEAGVEEFTLSSDESMLTCVQNQVHKHFLFLVRTSVQKDVPCSHYCELKDLPYVAFQLMGIPLYLIGPKPC